MSGKYPYVGIRADRSYAAFRSDVRHDLHAGLCPEPFVAVVGPFKTVRGADYMVKNPRVRCVADAEELAKLESKS